MYKSLILLILGCILVRFGNTLGGGYREWISSDDPEVGSAARWAAGKLNGELVSVTSAERQVVAGLMYYIDMKIMTAQQKIESCTVKVWVRSWLNSIKLVQASCKPLNK